MDMLQSVGIYCIDEYFNAVSFRPGLHAKTLFGDYLRNIKPLGKDSLYTALEQISGVCDDKSKFAGVKICWQQRDGVHDFDKVMNDRAILKIFHYRETLTYYMTKYFHPKWADWMRGVHPEYKMEPSPYVLYEQCIANGAENYITVNSEDIFDTKENSIDVFCKIIGADAQLLRQNALNSIKDCPETTIRELLDTAPGYLAEEFEYRFSDLEYEIDKDKKYLDCRKANVNLGFLGKDKF
jgi:hypothetical protein